MDFEFDSEKSASNKSKHGIDFYEAQELMKKKFIKAEEFDKKFDDGQDVSEFLDFSKTERPGEKQKRVEVDFPDWMLQSLDKEAKRLGVSRQSIIKVWIAERLKEISA
jgi:hypothetical protein